MYLSDAEEMAERFENKGIATHISSKRSHSLSGHRTGATKVGLWVILEHQSQDAIEYLHNWKHKITTGISPEEIVNLMQQSNIASYNSLNKFLIYAFSGVVIIVLVSYFIVSKVGLFNI